MNDKNCIFCKIARKELPSVVVYEDDTMLAFLDINPVNIGHTLIIPKKHFENLYDTPEDLMAEMMKVIKSLGTAIKEAVHADGINIEMNNEKPAGQVILHTHMHIVPRHEGDGFTQWKGKRDYNDGEMEEVSMKIKSFVK